MDHKKQHWIPRSYLKAWCDPEHRDNVVHVYRADGEYKGWRAYSRIFSTDDLYTIAVGGKRDLTTEKAFKHIEDRFLRVRRAIECEGSLPAASKRILGWFVSATRNRSPTARDQWQLVQNRIVQIGDEMAAALAKASPVERKRMARASAHTRPDRFRLMTMNEARAAAAEPFGKWVLRHVAIEARLLEQMSFAVMKAPAGTSFITSDNPVVWHDAAPPGKRCRHLGLRHPYIEISMPLTPRYCLIFDHLGKDGTCDVSQETVDMFNSRTLNDCENCFIAQNSKLRVDWFETAGERHS